MRTNISASPVTLFLKGVKMPQPSQKLGFFMCVESQNLGRK
jgi:hypothetical protein